MLGVRGFTLINSPAASSQKEKSTGHAVPEHMPRRWFEFVRREESRSSQDRRFPVETRNGCHAVYRYSKFVATAETPDSWALLDEVGRRRWGCVHVTGMLSDGEVHAKILETVRG